jgi:hypothetical protein
MDLKNFNSFKVKQMIPPVFCQYFTHVLLRKADNEPGGDAQCPTAKAVIAHEYMFDTILERLWIPLENLLQEKILPTYSYSRLYTNGDVLTPHTDRPECEISVTIQLGRSHNYTWPIFIGDNRYDLNEGDAIIYSGGVNHWREKCDGPEGYYSGQLFLHYVRENGPYADKIGDPDFRGGSVTFDKERTLLMETK